MTGHTHFRAYVTSTVGVCIGGLVYLSCLLNFGWNPGRTAVTLGFASNFFDIQGRAILDGQLSVPADSLGIEGFVINGKTYMYFPPFPALARLPILMTTDEFDGRLTVLMMALAWGIYAVMSARFVWLVRLAFGRKGPPSLRECVGVAALIAAITGGTVLTFDAALPWVYHEVYAWAAAFVMTGAYWMARFFLLPSRNAAVWIGVAALGAVMTRTTGGFALAIVCVLCGCYFYFRPHRGGRPTPRPAAVALLLAGLIPVGASVLLNIVKFNHPYLFPLEDQIWTTVNTHRREALDQNGGTITGPQFILSTAQSYLRPDGIRFTEYFPWVSLPARPAPLEGDALLDQTYRTGSVPAFMPLLTILTLLAFVSVPALARRRRTRALLPPLAASVLLIGPVLMYGYITHRYTSEFVPLLVVGGAIGFWVLWELGDSTSHTMQRLLVSTVVLGSALALGTQTLTAQPAAAFGQRGDELEAHVARQLSLPGSSALRPLITRGDRLPVAGRTDELFVLGDCDALFVNTGDRYDQWVLVQQRPLVAGIFVTEDSSVGRIPVFAIDGPQRRVVSLEVGADRRGRVLISAEDGEVAGSWFPLHVGTEVRLGLGVRADLGYADVTSTPGGHVAYVPWLRYDIDSWETRPGEIHFLETDLTAAEHGVKVRDLSGVSLPLCREVLSRGR